MTQERYSGPILAIETRPYTNVRTRRPGTMYNINTKLGWMRWSYDKAPPFTEGSLVDFDYEIVERNGKEYKNALPDTLQFIQDDRKTPAVSQARATAAPAAGRSSAAARDTTYEDKQNSIVWQHSQEMAIYLAQLLLDNKALPMSEAQNSKGVAKRFAEITSMVDKLTLQLFNDVNTMRLRDSVEDPRTVPAAAEEEDDDGDIPDDLTAPKAPPAAPAKRRPGRPAKAAAAAANVETDNDLAYED